MDERYKLFKVGDIVTRRGGGDEHEIISIDEDHFCMDVKCIKDDPEWPYCEVGSMEHNTCIRYDFVRNVK